MKAFLILTAAVVLAGCAVGPDYRAPHGAMPTAFAHADAASAGPASGTNQIAGWWKVFNDAQLDALIHEAASSNLDVRIAKSRVLEAKALRGVTRSGLFPQVNADGDYSRSRLSKNSIVGRQLAPAGQPLENNSFDLGLDASWEIDVFGGTRRAAQAAQADLEASIESGRDVLVTVLAEVGLSYLDLRGTQKELAVTRENLRLQERTLALTRDRLKAGLASELDSTRAQAQAASTRADIAPHEEAEQRAMHRLSVLLGKQPAELESQLAVVRPIPGAPPRVPVGLPSDLLRQRPDIRRAERQIAAANARVGVATADLFPKFYLTGAAGLQSIESSDFFDGGSRFWSLGPTVQWPIFTAGRIRQNIKVQNARHEQALMAYDETVLTSLEEVENGLVAFGKEQDRYRALVESENANRRAVELADSRYRSGLVDFLNVLDTEGSLLAVQNELARSEQTLGQNLVRLYKALGGGWQEDGKSNVVPQTVSSQSPARISNPCAVPCNASPLTESEFSREHSAHSQRAKASLRESEIHEPKQKESEIQANANIAD